MLTDRTRVREGMTVYSSDGEKLGKVIQRNEDSFVIEKGFFFPKDYTARYEDVADVLGEDELRLTFTKDSFERAGERHYEAGGYDVASATHRSTGEDVRVPVTEEELDVVKRERDAGEVRLRKEVVTETKQVDVPITREEVRVERVPAGEREPTAGDRTFEEERVSMPLHEEEVEIRKRPVVKEEVRLRKERVTEHRAAEADVRSERVEIEGEGGVHRVSEDPDPGAAPRRDDDDPLR